MKKNVTYIDYMRIHCPGITKFQLQRRLPIDKLKQVAKDIKIEDVQYRNSSSTYRKGHGATIHIYGADNKLLQQLSDYEYALGDHYISYIELAQDILCPSKQAAIDLYDEIKCRVWRRYISLFMSYGSDCSTLKDDEENPDRRFSDQTYYLGNRKNRLHFIMYPCHSKPFFPNTLKPSVHLEFRIRRSESIAKKLGVSELSDLLDLDLDAEFKKLFQNNIRLNDINHEAHGRFMTNSKRKNPQSQLEAIQDSNEFCDRMKIHNYTELRSYYKEAQANLKKKRGNRSRWEEKIEQINYYRLGCFRQAATSIEALAHLEEQ